MYELIIRNAKVADGMGNPLREVDGPSNGKNLRDTSAGVA